MGKFKDSLPTAVQIATIISLVALPLVLHFGQARSERSIATAELERQYVQMAVEILRSPPADNVDRTRLRAWALEIVDKYAPVKLSTEAKEEILKGGWLPPGWVPDGWFPPGWNPE